MCIETNTGKHQEFDPRKTQLLDRDALANGELRGAGKIPSRPPVSFFDRFFQNGQEWKERMLRRWLAYKAPNDDQQKRYALMREQYANLAVTISQLTPEGDDQVHALRLLRQSMMLANAAIANENELF